MNFRLTAALFAVVTLLLVGLLVSALTHDAKREIDPSSLVVAPLVESGVTSDRVETITLARTEPAPGELTFTFAKSGEQGGKRQGKWVQSTPGNARLDQGEVAALVRDLYDLKATPFAELTENLTTQGLNPPTLRVTLAGLGQSLAINFGRTTAGGPQKAVTFVTTSANPERPFAVRRGDLGGVFRAGPSAPADGLAGPMAKWGGDYRVRRFLGESRDPVNETTQITIVGGGKTLELAKARGDWRFLVPVGYGRADEAGAAAPQPPAAPFTGVRPLILALSNLAGGPEAFVDTPDPAVTGLDDSSAIRVSLTGPNRDEEVVLGKPVVGADGKPVSPTEVYARVPGEAGAVKVPFDRLNSLWATLDAPQALRDRELVPPAEREKLDAIDLTAGGSTVKLRRVPVAGGRLQWVVYGGPAGPIAAKDEPVGRLVNILTRPRAGRDMLPALSDPNVTGPALQATVKAWAGTAPPPDAKLAAGQYPPEPGVTGPPTVELDLGKREGESVYARRATADSKADYKLPESLVNLALTPRLAWLDPKFATCNPAQAEKIAYNREGKSYELQKVGENWAFIQPEALKGKLADTPRVRGLIDQLAGITAQTVLAEKPTDEQLRRANLDPASPRLRVRVTAQDGGEKKIVYEFGADTEDGRAVFFRQLGVPVLARADRRPLDLLLGGDLRDRTVYRIDPKTVTRVQLRGRMGTEQIQTVAVERKGADWVSPNPNLKPDAAKVNQLVSLLAAPRCENYVGPGKPEYGTDVTQQPRAVEIVVDRVGGPPVSLVLGSPAPGNLVYAASSAATESFTLDPTPYLPLVATPTGLGK